MSNMLAYFILPNIVIDFTIVELIIQVRFHNLAFRSKEIYIHVSDVEIEFKEQKSVVLTFNQEFALKIH